jgi:hypothetical protein
VLKKIQHDLHHGSQSCDFGPNCFKVAGKPASPIRLASERASLTRNYEKLFAKLTAYRAMSNAKGFSFRHAWSRFDLALIFSRAASSALMPLTAPKKIAK